MVRENMTTDTTIITMTVIGTITTVDIGTGAITIGIKP